MNNKTAKLIRKFASEMSGNEEKTKVKAKYKAFKKNYVMLSAPEKARTTALMRKTLASA